VPVCPQGDVRAHGEIRSDMAMAMAERGAESMGSGRGRSHCVMDWRFSVAVSFSLPASVNGGGGAEPCVGCCAGSAEICQRDPREEEGRLFLGGDARCLSISFLGGRGLGHGLWVSASGLRRPPASQPTSQACGKTEIERTGVVPYAGLGRRDACCCAIGG